MKQWKVLVKTYINPRLGSCSILGQNLKAKQPSCLYKKDMCPHRSNDNVVSIPYLSSPSLYLSKGLVTAIAWYLSSVKMLTMKNYMLGGPRLPIFLSSCLILRRTFLSPSQHCLILRWAGHRIFMTYYQIKLSDIDSETHLILIFDNFW